MAAFLYKAADLIRPRTNLHVQCGIRISDWSAVPADYLYIDHAYFRHQSDYRHVRLTRGWVHQIEVGKFPDDRLHRYGVTIEPWRKAGMSVVVIPPSGHQQSCFGLSDWLENTVNDIKRATDRPVLVKYNKEVPLRRAISNAWAVVTWASVAGVEAALMGVPVFSTPNCPSWPVSAGPLSAIDSPEYKERHDWACSLAYSTWHFSELPSIDLDNYRHARRHDL